MFELTVLSPHRDDAAFSLFTALSRWGELGLGIRVVNFFTVSSYAPRIQSSESSIVSLTREREDRKVLRKASRRIRIDSHHFLDAPLRLRIPLEAITRPESAELSLQTRDVQTIRPIVDSYVRRGLVIAPLALGEHVDHLAVWRAAAGAALSRKIAFYEDLPYAAWTDTRALQRRVLQTEKSARLILRSTVVRGRSTVARKRRAISQYASQIQPEEADAIARFANRYQGGERIWIPRYCTNWIRLVQQTHDQTTKGSVAGSCTFGEFASFRHRTCSK